MTDLIVCVPSRGRPGNVSRLISACKRTCTADTLIHFGFDEDDPLLSANLGALDWNITAAVMPRMGLTAWTNHLAKRAVIRAPAVGSLGDDMIPRTHGWDTMLLEEIGRMGGGMAYPNDHRRDDIPEAIVMSSWIIDALGYMAPPAMDHWYIDNAWRDLGNGAGCLAYRGDIVVEHLHPTRPGLEHLHDQTYEDAAAGFKPDLKKYQRWRLMDLPKDIEKIKDARDA